MKLKLLALLLFLICSYSTRATHVLGGYIHAEQMSINNGAQTSLYLVTTVLYVSCEAGVAPPPASVTTGAYDLVTDAAVGSAMQPEISTDTLHICDSCSMVNACVMEITYQDTLTLPFNANGYYFQYQTFARHTTDNVFNTGGQGISLYAEIPDPMLSNSTPIFTGWQSSTFLCTNGPDFFPMDAIDLDGDSLVYSLADPLDCSSTAPSTTGTYPKPYPVIMWQTPYSLADLVGGSTPLSIDASTGWINASDPLLIGRFLGVVKVEEYRNGTKIGESNIEFVMYSTNCAVASASASPNPVILSQGDTVFFTNNSSIVGTYCWDFGNGDTSMQFEPYAIYTSPGNYVVQLIAKNGNCTDTAYINVEVLATNGVNDPTAQQIMVFPNPAEETLQLDITGPAEITIRDVNGRLTGRFTNHYGPLDVGNLAPGIYTLEINKDGTPLRGKFVKQ